MRHPSQKRPAFYNFPLIMFVPFKAGKSPFLLQLTPCLVLSPFGGEYQWFLIINSWSRNADGVLVINQKHDKENVLALHTGPTMLNLADHQNKWQ